MLGRCLALPPQLTRLHYAIIHTLAFAALLLLLHAGLMSNKGKQH
jgi:hypothetical protein